MLVALADRAREVSPAWFYKWRDGDSSLRRAHRAALAAMVVALFAPHRGTYGSPRITADLHELGWRVSANTVAAVMAEHQLAARHRRRRGSTRSGKGRWRVPDLVSRNFRADDRSVPPRSSCRSPACSTCALRRIVGFALGDHSDAGLAYAALAMAVAVRGEAVPGVVLHTDGGSEYTAGAFRSSCDRQGIRQSMGRPGSALDNAVIEPWHSTLTFELLDLEQFPTKAAARRRVAEWIEEYNRDRRHSALAMRAPVAFEQAHQSPAANPRAQGVA